MAPNTTKGAKSRGASGGLGVVATN